MLRIISDPIDNNVIDACTLHELLVEFLESIDVETNVADYFEAQAADGVIEEEEIDDLVEQYAEEYRETLSQAIIVQEIENETGVKS
jgi:predicted DNA-binding protein (UPF0278 family)